MKYKMANTNGNGWGFDDLEAMLLDPRIRLEDVALRARAEAALDAEEGVERLHRDTVRVFADVA